MNKNLRTDTDDQLQKVLSESLEQSFPDGFENRVMTAIARSRNNALLDLEEMANQMVSAFWRISSPAMAVCLLLFVYNAQAGNSNLYGSPSSLVETIFNIPPEYTSSIGLF